ncbi:MAG: hypothetical protein QOG62_1698 [Thermoleophilaceae bacterium]|jgi:hypothetical protein|nr:hypothetical protein [Thermoleophilaceae bacterium]
MGIGTSVFLIAVGAIFKFALTDTLVGGVRLDVVGLILILVGIVGLVVSMFVASAARRRGAVVVQDEREIL